MTTEPDKGSSPLSSGGVTLIGLRILIVEDQGMIAMALEDMLFDLGCVVVGPALNFRTAMELATTGMLDGAVLDIHLGDDRSFPVAEILRRQGVPFVFATGYGDRGLEPPFEEAPVLPKPYSLVALELALVDIFKAAKQL
jgi:CheY-like chemotaxis protein